MLCSLTDHLRNRRRRSRSARLRPRARWSPRPPAASGSATSRSTGPERQGGDAVRRQRQPRLQRRPGDALDAAVRDLLGARRVLVPRRLSGAAVKYMQDLAADYRQADQHDVGRHAVHGLRAATARATASPSAARSTTRTAYPANGCPPYPGLVGATVHEMPHRRAAAQPRSTASSARTATRAGSTNIYFLFLPDGVGNCFDTAARRVLRQGVLRLPQLTSAGRATDDLRQRVVHPARPGKAAAPATIRTGTRTATSTTSSRR